MPWSLVAGIMVFFRVAFGMWVGIIAAVVQAFFAFFWIFSPYWPAALVIIALDLVVIYALSSPTRGVRLIRAHEGGSDTPSS